MGSVNPNQSFVRVPGSNMYLTIPASSEMSSSSQCIRRRKRSAADALAPKTRALYKFGDANAKVGDSDVSLQNLRVFWKVKFRSVKPVVGARQNNSTGIFCWLEHTEKQRHKSLYSNTETRYIQHHLHTPRY
jgi:hypothetical protein